jgi:hypothetical protein
MATVMGLVSRFWLSEGHRDREIQAPLAGRWRPRAAGGVRYVHRPKFVAVKGSDFVCTRMLPEDIGVAVIPGNDKGTPERLIGGAAELRDTPKRECADCRIDLIALQGITAPSYSRSRVHFRCAATQSNSVIAPALCESPKHSFK